MVGAQSHAGARSMAMESLYEYGSRAGFWRLHRMFTERQAPLTVFGVAMALARNPQAVAAMQAAEWEIASHGLRWIDYQHIPEDVERRHIAEAIALHTQVTGERPLGWYQGRTSPNTARLVVEEGGFVYDADSYADDLPYYDTPLRQAAVDRALYARRQRHEVRGPERFRRCRTLLPLSARHIRPAVCQRVER